MATGILLAVSGIAQHDTLKHPLNQSGGLTVEYGFGKYAVRDEYISKQKYSGSLPLFSLNWSRFKPGRGYVLGIESRSSEKIFSYKVSCRVTQNTLKQDYFYSIGKFRLFNNDINTYLGPSITILLFTFNYDFGTYNHVITESNGTIVSLGLNTQFISNLTKKISAEGGIHLSIASITAKAFQSDKHDEPESKFLLVPKALNSGVDIGLRCFIFKSLSVKVLYRLHIYQINEWDPLIAASNNLIFSATYHL